VSRRLLQRHPRLHRWWYQLTLPRLIAARAKARHWTRRSRLGRLLCAPLPAAALALAQYLGMVAGVAALLALLRLAELAHCARGAWWPACDLRCMDRQPPALRAELARRCWPLPWESGADAVQGDPDAPRQR
jgi:hypothetical protein